MNRLIVIERKRIIPLILLIVLMGGLTLYDNFRGEIGEVMPVKDEDSKVVGEKMIGEKVSKELSSNEIDYVTADRGFRSSLKSFEVAEGLEDWLEILENNELSLPNYPYNEYTEAGLFAFNSEVKKIELVTDNEKSVNEKNQLQLEVEISKKDNHYHVLAVSKDKLTRQGEIQKWRFVNEQGDEVYQLTTSIE